ncbi:MAG: dTDP-4-dehydrorhamnose reductase [Pseudomonadota bacterium]
MRKILVFGQSGQVAQSLADLTSSHFEIKCVGRPAGDIVNAASVTHEIDTFHPDLVINAAAYTAVDKAETEKELAFAVNCDGPRNLAKACKSANVPLIHYSTDYVFNGTGEDAWTETDITSPLGVYGESKLEGERALQETWDKHYILRTAWVYSPYGQNFVKTMLRLSQDRDALNVVDDQVGNPTYAPDIAAATLLLAERALSPDAHFGTYHLAGSGSTSWFGFAKSIFEDNADLIATTCDVHPIPSTAYPTPAERPKNSRLDCTKLSDIHGIELPTWQSSVRRCIKVLAEGF